MILRFDDESHRIDVKALTGKAVTVHAQHEVLKVPIAARLPPEHERRPGRDDPSAGSAVAGSPRDTSTRTRADTAPDCLQAGDVVRIDMEDLGVVKNRRVAGHDVPPVPPGTPSPAPGGLTCGPC